MLLVVASSAVGLALLADFFLHLVVVLIVVAHDQRPQGDARIELVFAGGDWSCMRLIEVVAMVMGMAMIL